MALNSPVLKATQKQAVVYRLLLRAETFLSVTSGLWITAELTYQWLRRQAHAHADNGEIPLYVAIDNKLAGILFIADKIKETSAEAIEGLQKGRH